MFLRNLMCAVCVLLMFPLVSQAELLGPDKALFKSERLTFESKKKTVNVDVDIKGVKQLYLVVSNGGDGMAFDHADWVNPVLVGPSGEKKLTDLKWKSATQEYGTIAINKTVDGKPLTMEGKQYENGIGTHATSIIVYDLPEGYERFKALAGIDDETLGNGRRATLQFYIFPGEPDMDILNGNVSDKFVPTKLFNVPEGLEVTIWATSPMLSNPTNIDVDSQGRIWVAEGMNYRGSRLSKDGDRIVVLEDKDGDGKAESSHTFVQDKELVSPLGVAVVGNKVIVSQPPDLLVYTDVNGDAKFDPSVDKKEVLLTGFQGKNHDHSLHAVTVGPNGQYYFNTGNAGNFITKDKEGTMVTAASGYNGGAGMAGKPSSDGHVYIGGIAMRINPDGTGLRVIGHNFRNSYEQTVTSFGDVFQNDNDDPPACRTTWLMEYGNLGFFSLDGQRHWGSERRPGQSTEIAEWRQEDPSTIPAGDVYGGGSPTGIVYYENGALGEKHRGLLLTCEPSRNVIFGYYPKPEGSGFKLERFDFMTSNPEKKFDGADFTGGTRDGRNVMTYFRPSDVAVGADGAIYVADWFDARVGGHATK
ncbi:MAG: NPCBM/NEW2 domain-containing protein, partial [Lentisphaeraceae bacterium]|nr:NPCBM/NEW2 domain-containing protein [Lentisphaeraceae bacterium]